MPRLVFADWLEERGDPRGEFIRLQCELETLDEDDPTRAEHESRCQLLLAMHKQAWVGELPKMVRDFRFKRGFVHWVQVMSRNFLEHGEELFALAPIRQVTINDINSYLDDVAASPHLARLEKLDIKPEFSWRQTDFPASLLTDDGLARLMARWHVWRTASLDLGYNRITNRGFIQCAEYNREGPVQRLDLSHNEITEAGMGWLNGGGMKELALNNNPFERFPAEVIAAAFRQIEVLRLESTNLTGEGLYHLVSSGPNSIRKMFLDGNSLDQECLQAVGLAPKSLGLVELSLNSISQSGDACALTLQGASLLALRRLSLRHNHMGYVGATALSSSQLSSLRHLDLRDNAIGDAGAAAIANSSTLANLTTLLLAENSIGDAGARALAESPYLERIVEIRVGNNPIGSAARYALQSRFGHRVIFDS